MFEAVYNVLDNIIDLDYSSVMHQLWSDKDIQLLIIKLNQINQLYDKGINSEGDSLGEYSSLTIEIKQEKSDPFDRITLFDEGVFYASFAVIPITGGFEIVADPFKEDANLFNVYGTEILGLTSDSKSKLIIESLPVLHEIIKKEICKR